MMSFRYLTRWAVVVAAALVTAHAQSTPPATVDLILRGGTVFDGTGAPGYTADVAISRGFIARVGDLASLDAPVELDVTGLYVAPGFINIHSHARPDGLPRAVNMLTQGVTTEIINADGGGSPDLDAALHRLRTAGLAVNVGANIGFNAVWEEVVGPADRRPTPAEIEKMQGLIRRGLEQGAWGVSAGLDYKPAYFATAEEVGQVVEVARPWRAVFTNHDRLTPESGFSSRVGVEETMAIAARAGLVPVVTHMQSQGHEQGKAPELLQMMAAATARGTYTAADVYPYLAGQSGLAALLVPGWALDGGREAMLKRFADPADRARIVQEAERAMRLRFGGPEGVYAIGHKKELVEAMKELGTDSPGEALVRLLETADGGAILRFGVESDLVAILRHPTASIACDCGAVAGEASHPRYYGTYPRVLGRYVREQRVLTWEAALHKMSGLPAATIGLANRGYLAPGMAADIVVFDPAAVMDHATFDAPTAPSTGIRHVFVNGRHALADGVPTGEQGGEALLRGPHEPARPASVAAGRKVSGRSEASVVDVRIDLEQRPDWRTPRGRFRLVDHASQTTIEMTEPGLLQVAPGWAAATGRGVVGTDEGALTVIVEQADPLDSAQGTTVTVIGEGGYRLTRVVRKGSLRVSPPR